VRDDTLRVVCEAASPAEEIDATRARSAEQRARERIEKAKSGGADAQAIDVPRAEASLKRALMRLQILDLVSKGLGSH
jgi:F-type H+-transporting ATPase subunit epsilon